MYRNPVWRNLPIWKDVWLFYSLKNVDDKFTFAMLDWLTGRSLLALNKYGFHHLTMIRLFLLIGPRSGLVSKGRIFWPVAFSILALPNNGGRGGMRFFWWNWPSIFIVCKLPSQLVPSLTWSCLLHVFGIFVSVSADELKRLWLLQRPTLLDVGLVGA